METEEIIRNYLIRAFLPGEDIQRLKYDTPILESGIVDSISIIELISFLEKKFGIDFLPRELDLDKFQTINDICNLIKDKRK